MSDDNGGRYPEAYRAARILAALLLVCLIVARGLLDVISGTFETDSTYAAVLLGAAVALLLGVRNWRP